MLQKVGVLSFTEPYWTDRVFDLKVEGFDEEAVGRVRCEILQFFSFLFCVVLSVLLLVVVGECLSFSLE